jgi:hypothetical protein
LCVPPIQGELFACFIRRDVSLGKVWSDGSVTFLWERLHGAEKFEEEDFPHNRADEVTGLWRTLVSGAGSPLGSTSSILIVGK